MNEITIRLCDEDRERLNKLTAALKEKASCDRCVETVVKALESVTGKKTAETPTAPATLPRNDAQANSEATTPPAEEKPAEAADEPQTAPHEPSADETLAAAPAVTLEQLQQRIVQLCAKFTDEQKKRLRSIVTEYAPRVSAIPEDERATVWQRIVDLEKEYSA